MPKRRSMVIRVMTYNIHKGIGGVDRRYDLDRIVNVIDHYQPDIAMLQEVDDGVRRSRADCQVDKLAKALNFGYRAFQRNVQLRVGHYGNAILSRFPISETHDVNLKIPLKKRRRALIAKVQIEIDGHSRSLLLCNTHLGLSGFERSMQIRRLLACASITHLHHDTPAIIGGDFNDIWSSLGRKLMFPVGFRCAVGRAKTFPAVLPVRNLDAIYYRGDLELQASFAGRTTVSRQASDHLPVIADFEIKLAAS